MLEKAVIFLIMYVVLIVTDFVPVLKKKKKKTIIFFICVFTLAVLLQYITIANVELPKFTILIEDVVKGLGLVKGE